MARTPRKQLHVVDTREGYITIAEGFGTLELPVKVSKTGEKYIVYDRKRYKVQGPMGLGCGAYPNNQYFYYIEHFGLG